MAREGWRRLEDGMDDPRVGGEELSRERQGAIVDVLRLMDCHDRRGVHCEHVDAVERLAKALHATANFVAVEAIRTLPRPLVMRDIEKTVWSMGTVTLLAAEVGERR